MASLYLRRISLPIHLVFLLLALLPQVGWPKANKSDASGTQSQPAPPLIIRSAVPLPQLEIPLVSEGPQIDGILDDPVWNRPPLNIGEWLSYNPLYGSKLPQKTQVWAVYDNAGLYFAFHCMDPEPDKIKSSISRRDMIWKDDWVGISLDSLGSHQSAYEFFVNPNGIQGDVLNTSTTGQDPAPDWIWESSAKKTNDGYMVEMRIPLKSIRFSGDDVVRMEILFWRRVSRLGISASWPDIPPGKSIFTRRAPMLLREVNRPLIFELIPNITHSLRQIHSSPGSWSSNSRSNAGFTVKYGITSAVTLDGTFRPDFSQVESDAFQMEVNQRFPVYYSEKRPFFMEGMGTLDLSGVGRDSNMRTAVHTRRIIDPQFGAKIAGTAGKMTFASLFALDQAPGNVEAFNPLYGKKKHFNIARMLYSVGKGSYVGALVTDTELGDGHNRVLAGDISLRFGEHQQLTATAITTKSRDFDGYNNRNGMAGQVYYAYRTKRQTFASQIEHYDKDFRMDTAFYNRTGITSHWTYYALNLYPDERRYSWFKMVQPYIWIQMGRDRVQRGNERFFLGGVQMNFTRQGVLQVELGRGRESWAGRTFNTRQIRISGSGQLYRWLNLSGQINLLRSIYYDPVNPFSGHVRDFHIGFTFQPNAKINLGTEYSRAVFDRATNGQRIYTVDIINTMITYQLNKNFFVRAIKRYDSSQKRLLMDYLASFELVPGTVAHAGYGALFERRDLREEQFASEHSNYVNTQRGFFFKLSYLYRF